MTAKCPSGTPLSATLASLLETVESDSRLPPARCREMASAIRTVCKVLKTDAHLLPASAKALQKPIKDALPAAVGVSVARWQNAVSLLRRSLALINPANLPARSTTVLSAGWRDLLGTEKAEPYRRGLARFSKWCSAQGGEPWAVTQEVYDRFFTELSEHCLLRDPRETQQTAGTAWEKARAAVPGWPAVELKIFSRRRNPSLPWDAFPASFGADVEDWLAEHAPRDEIRFDEYRVEFRPLTIIHKRTQIRQIATAMVEGGVPIASLTGLADLVRLENVQVALNGFHERAGKQKTARMHGLACLLLALARHRVKDPPDVIAGLQNYCRTLTPKDTGMTQKNRSRLRQFDDERQLHLFLGLPDRLMQAATTVEEPKAGEARLAQMAVVIEILINAPLRISNIAALEIGRTLLLGSGNTGHIVVGRDEVKNEYELHVPLPASTVAMIRTYLKRFHRMLAPPGCNMLFPSADGGHKRSPSLGTQISQLIRRECGIEMNAQCFRHFAAMLFLRANPGAYGVVKLLLGHKSIETTMRVYCGAEADAAFQRFEEVIGFHKGQQPRVAPKPSGSSSKLDFGMLSAATSRSGRPRSKRAA